MQTSDYGARAINDPSAINVAQVILSGAQRESRSGTVSMPAFEHAYSDVEIAAVAHYVTARFGTKRSDLSAQQVAELRRSR
jgi:mono/diheme cytochrome c family protein